jgi:hypothetical protein
MPRRLDADGPIPRVSFVDPKRATKRTLLRYARCEVRLVSKLNEVVQEGPMNPIVRVSILRCAPDRFSEMRQMMLNAEKVLGPGIESMRGLLAYYGGADEATSSLTNVSVWTDLAAAKQMDTFQPMLDLGKEFAAKGATFERPIMNYATLWQLRPSATK